MEKEIYYIEIAKWIAYLSGAWLMLLMLTSLYGNPSISHLKWASFIYLLSTIYLYAESNG